MRHAQETTKKTFTPALVRDFANPSFCCTKSVIFLEKIIDLTFSISCLSFTCECCDQSRNGSVEYGDM
jgi:hypothetical protein